MRFNLVSAICPITARLTLNTRKFDKSWISAFAGMTVMDIS